MKVQLNQVIKNFYEAPVTKEGGEKYTVRDVLADSILTQKDAQSITNEEKMKRWTLAKKVQKSKDSVEMTIEEVAKIKELVLANATTWVAGQVADALEGVKEEEVK